MEYTSNISFNTVFKRTNAYVSFLFRPERTKLIYKGNTTAQKEEEMAKRWREWTEDWIGLVSGG